MGTRVSFGVQKCPGCESDCSSPSIAKVTNECRNASTSPVCCHGMNRDRFTGFIAGGTDRTFDILCDIMNVVAKYYI